MTTNAEALAALQADAKTAKAAGKSQIAVPIDLFLRLAVKGSSSKDSKAPADDDKEA